MRDQLRIGSGLCWTAAWALAAAGPALYLVWPDDLSWWLAGLPAVPLVLLAEWRRERKGLRSDPYATVSDGGPWGPPSDHGGF